MIGLYANRLGDDLEVVVREETGPEDPAHVAVSAELGTARRGLIEVNGDELPDEVRDAAADADNEVRDALLVLDAGVDEGRNKDRGEAGQDGLAWTYPSGSGGAVSPE